MRYAPTTFDRSCPACGQPYTIYAEPYVPARIGRDPDDSDPGSPPVCWIEVRACVAGTVDAHGDACPTDEEFAESFEEEMSRDPGENRDYDSERENREEQSAYRREKE